jgi:branched-chain amino acid aminotransferase
MDFMTFAQDVRKIKKGESRNFSLNIVPQETDNFSWTAVVRILESEGFVIGCITDNFPTGVYIADGLTENGQLQGWQLENEIPRELIVTNIGWSFLSKKPAAPQITEGLKMVPHHVMAISFCENENWSDFMYIPTGRIAISLADTSGIQYGQSGFEGCMTMRDKFNDVFAFRLDQNAQRFDKTVQSLDLPSFNPEKHRIAMETVVKYNKAYVPKLGEGKLYIRPSVSGLCGGLGVIVPDVSVVTIEVAAFGDYLPPSIKVEGRLDVHRPPTGANKIAPNYGGTFKIKHGVKARGYHDYLSFDDRGMVEEVATCAAAFIDKDNNYIFPPVSNEIDKIDRHILPSITRKSVIEILKKQGKTVIIRDIHFKEVKQMQGFFTMGNAVGVLMVSEICMKKSEDDSGEIIKFSDKKIEKTIYQLRDDIYASRTQKLAGFEVWAKKI